MAKWYDGQPYTSFRAINLKDGSLLVESGAYKGVLRATPGGLTANRTYTLPDDSGYVLVGAYGSAAVSYSSIAAGSLKSTIITDSNVKQTDLVVACFAQSISDSIAVVAAEASNGGIRLTLANLTSSEISIDGRKVNYIVIDRK